MSLQEVEAKVTKGDRANEVFTVNYDIPDNIEDAIKRFGEEVVHSRFAASLTIDLQSFVRTQIQKDGATPATIQTAVDAWVPGVRKRGKTGEERLREALAAMPAEERLALLAPYLDSKDEGADVSEPTTVGGEDLDDLEDADDELG